MAEPLSVFEKELRLCKRYIDKQSQLHQVGQMGIRDLHFATEITFLRAIVAMENFLEEQLIALLVGKAYFQGQSVSTRVTVTTHRMARELVYGGRQYVDLLPYDKTEKVAKLYLTGGRPFTNLNANSKRQLRQFLVIRNAIAHKSRHSLRQFNIQIIEPRPLRGSVKSPAQYLLSAATTSRTRLEMHLGDLLNIARLLA